jgi:hypothetical protein
MNLQLPVVRQKSFAASAEVRAWLVEQLRLDLIGPGPADTSLHAEALLRPPSQWYLTGYLVPIGAPDEQRAGDADSEGNLDSGDEAGGADDQTTPDPASARKAWRPSSIGLSFFVEEKTESIEVEAVWGDYKLVEPKPAAAPAEGANGEGPKPGSDKSDGDGEKESESEFRHWQREHRTQTETLDIRAPSRRDVDVRNSGGLQLALLVRHAALQTETGKRSVKSVSVFLVNRREPLEEKGRADEAFAFQTRLAIRSAAPFVERPDVRGLHALDWDDRVADLHYCDVTELAVGHNVSADWQHIDGGCREIVTAWTPVAAVPRVIPNPSIANFELGMETLGQLPDSAAAKAALAGVVSNYRVWIAEQRKSIGGLVARRRDVAEQLLIEAEAAAKRIEDGIACLDRANVLEAFRIANRAIARAARQREAQIKGIKPADVDAPRWRPFQLAFILLNLRGLVDQAHDDREQVDLLFFPTGGGKTEAYLGLAAFAIAFRRLSNPGHGGAGLTVLMRYTLRLLTLDQLGRAAAVVCALELERLAGTAKLGDWPVEIGLWVGRAATPNRMGYKGDNDARGQTARRKVIAYKNNTKKPMPVPIKTCPWCGTPFDKDSFHLIPNYDQPENLELRCVSRACDFHLSKRPLPILTVDEPIYRRLPAFMIATVDKFAGMPWTGEIASFFGGADRHDGKGFFGRAQPSGGVPLPKPLLPPDLIIQDELHLISGPLGTMVGLYETALDWLCTRQNGEGAIRPKIVASTATVRRAENQIRALFGRRQVTVFPPPGPGRRTSFFAQTLGPDDPGARCYFGLAAPGGSPKVLFLRALITLMTAAETAWAQSKPDEHNPADPYMTLVAYFNALRELGGARRIVEGEIGPRLRTYSRRLRLGETTRFADREIKYDVMELTSRVPTDEVSEAKRRLASPFKDKKDRVDVALATNMISVGLDITRLGLMAVSGQPKTTAEYIQATSRVGREEKKPGLVLALLNVNKPRDRSH